MNTPEELHRSIDYVLNMLDDAHRRAFEREIASNPECRADVDTFNQVVADVLLTTHQVTPPSHLKARLMDAIRTEDQEVATRPAPQHWKQWEPVEESARVLHRAATAEWEETSFDGVEVRRLQVDKDQDRVTMVIRMAPGARYPSHRHGGREECFVLQGDLRHAAQVMRPGDYERCQAGSVHGEQWTEEGCLLLVTSSQSDVLLA